MKKQDSVSLWIGKSRSANDLKDFLRITYNEDGDYIPSPFACGFRTGRYDDDFREAKYYEQYLTQLSEISKDFSYYNIIMPKFEKIIKNNINEPFNAVIFLYNFEYNEIQKNYTDSINSFNYVGAVEYK
jgi:Immunity protein 22